MATMCLKPTVPKQLNFASLTLDLSLALFFLYSSKKNLILFFISYFQNFSRASFLCKSLKLGATFANSCRKIQTLTFPLFQTLIIWFLKTASIFKLCNSNDKSWKIRLDELSSQNLLSDNAKTEQKFPKLVKGIPWVPLATLLAFSVFIC